MAARWVCYFQATLDRTRSPSGWIESETGCESWVCQLRSCVACWPGGSKISSKPACPNINGIFSFLSCQISCVQTGLRGRGDKRVRNEFSGQLVTKKQCVGTKTLAHANAFHGQSVPMLFRPLTSRCVSPVEGKTKNVRNCRMAEGCPAWPDNKLLLHFLFTARMWLKRRDEHSCAFAKKSSQADICRSSNFFPATRYSIIDCFFNSAASSSAPNAGTEQLASEQGCARNGHGYHRNSLELAQVRLQVEPGWLTSLMFARSG